MGKEQRTECYLWDLIQLQASKPNHVLLCQKLWSEKETGKETAVGGKRKKKKRKEYGKYGKHTNKEDLESDGQTWQGCGVYFRINTSQHPEGRKLQKAVLLCTLLHLVSF